MGDTRGIRSYVVAVLVLVAAGLLSVVTVAARTTLPADCRRQCVETRTGYGVTFGPYFRTRMTDIDVTRPSGTTTRCRAARSGWSTDASTSPGRAGCWPTATPGSAATERVTFDNQAATSGAASLPTARSDRGAAAHPLPASAAAGVAWHVEVRAAAAIAVDAGHDRHLVGLRRATATPWRQARRQLRRGRYNRDQLDRDGDRSATPATPTTTTTESRTRATTARSSPTPTRPTGTATAVGNACDDTPGTAPGADADPRPRPDHRSAHRHEPPADDDHARAAPAPAPTRAPSSCGTGRSATACRARSPPSRSGCRRDGPGHDLAPAQGRRPQARSVLTTRSSGDVPHEGSAPAGRYYATVGSAAEPMCGTDRSRAVRIKRR